MDGSLYGFYDSLVPLKGNEYDVPKLNAYVKRILNIPDNKLDEVYRESVRVSKLYNISAKDNYINAVCGLINKVLCEGICKLYNGDYWYCETKLYINKSSIAKRYNYHIVLCIWSVNIDFYNINEFVNKYPIFKKFLSKDKKLKNGHYILEVRNPKDVNSFITLCKLYKGKMLK